MSRKRSRAEFEEEDGGGSNSDEDLDEDGAHPVGWEGTEATLLLCAAFENNFFFLKHCALITPEIADDKCCFKLCRVSLSLVVL